MTTPTTTHVGQTATLTFTVAEADTARALGSGDLPVLGTPRVLAWCEAATCAALDLEASQTSVGSRVQLEHVGASPLAATLTVTATVTYADGRLVRFEVVAQHADDELVVAHGEVTRVVVDRERFLGRLG
jgi:predicted thioesterase